MKEQRADRSIVSVSTPWGMALRAFADDKSHMPGFVDEGMYWPVETDKLSGLVQPGMVVLDVGANLGYHTALFSHLVGRSGRVIAVEPDPSSFSLLQENISLNRIENATAVQCAVGAASGWANLWLSETNFACNSLVPTAVPNSRKAARTRVVTVDELLGDAVDARIDLIKIDCEGSEGDVLAGAVETVRRHSPKLWLEFWPHGLRLAGTDPQDLLKKLHEAGYTVQAVDLISGATWRVEIGDGATLVSWCDRMSDHFIARGENDLYGIAYLYAEPSSL